MIQSFPEPSGSSPLPLCIFHFRDYAEDFPTCWQPAPCFGCWLLEFERELSRFAGEFCWPAGGWRRFPRGFAPVAP